MNILIMRDQLIAALPLVPKKDVRYYLVGVLVEATGTETRVVSSNGSVLSVQRAAVCNEIEGTVSLILPRTLVERVKKSTLTQYVTLIKTGDDWRLEDDTNDISFKPVDGKYPEYRCMLASKPSGAASRFDPELLQLFVKAAAVFGIKSPNVLMSQSGEDTILVSIGRDAEYIGAMMPLRESKLPAKLTAAPSWVKAELIAQEELI